MPTLFCRRVWEDGPLPELFIAEIFVFGLSPMPEATALGSAVTTSSLVGFVFFLGKLLELQLEINRHHPLRKHINEANLMRCGKA